MLKVQQSISFIKKLNQDIFMRGCKHSAMYFLFSFWSSIEFGGKSNVAAALPGLSKKNKDLSRGKIWDL